MIHLSNTMNQALTLPQFMLNYSMSLITSISESMVVYFDDTEAREVMLRRQNQNSAVIEEVLWFDSKMVRPTARDKVWQWLTDAEMPFSKSKLARESNLTLFDENKVKNLQISILNGNSESILICYFVFGEQNPLFGHSTELALTTENKMLIANMMSNYVLQLRHLYNQQLETTRFLHDQFRFTEQQLRQLYQKSGNAKEVRADLVAQFCEIRLAALSEKMGVEFELSAQSIKELDNNNVSLIQVEDILCSATHRLQVMFPLDKRLIIEPWHLGFELEDTEMVGNESSISDIRYSRTIDLLNKLEDAGKRVKKLHLKLTGTNVGMHCETPISAPAITDALRKHSNRIVKLMNLYPDRWTLLRTDFRPLQNLLDTRDGREDLGVG